MTWDQLLNKTVQFKAPIEENEVGFEENMRAKVVEVSDEGDGCIKVIFDFSKHEEYNKEFMSPDYYDKNCQPTLKWFETNHYPEDKREDVYLDETVPAENFVTLLENEDTLVAQLEMLIPIARKLNLDKVFPLLEGMVSRERTIDEIGE